MPKPAPRTNHGRVCFLAREGAPLGGVITVTLAGTEHVLSVDEALGLAKAIYLTAVDRAERNMHDDPETMRLIG